MRSNLALQHKNFLNEFMSNYVSADADALESEYDGICAQVDKITLKLIFKMVEISKVDAVLDLVNRLHLERSFEIAMEAADRSNLRRLSDRIFSMKEARFDLNEDDVVDDEDDMSYDNNMQTYSHDRDVEEQSVQVSPEGNNSNKKRKLEDDEYSVKPKTQKRVNPFAIKNKQSPGKIVHMSPAFKKPTLSRLSTFSAESRRVSKAKKEFI